jgi:hypothetical protein
MTVSYAEPPMPDRFWARYRTESDVLTTFWVQPVADILNPQRTNCPETMATEIHGPKTGRNSIEEKKQGKEEEKKKNKKKKLCLTAKEFIIKFYIFLTLHLSIILIINQLNAQILFL